MAAVSGLKRVVYSKIKLPLFTHPHDDPNLYAVICSRVHATRWQLIVTTSLKKNKEATWIHHKSSSEDTCSEFRFIYFAKWQTLMQPQTHQHFFSPARSCEVGTLLSNIPAALRCRTRDPRDKHSFIMSCQEARGSMSRCCWFNRRLSDTLRPSTTTSQIYNSQPASGLPIICHY